MCIFPTENRIGIVSTSVHNLEISVFVSYLAVGKIFLLVFGKSVAVAVENRKRRIIF